MKQILIRKPFADVVLKRVGNIGYIFIKPKTAIISENLNGIPEWFRLNDGEKIGFYPPSAEGGSGIAYLQYYPLFNETTGAFVQGTMMIYANGWDPQYSTSLVVNMNDHVNEGED